MNTARGVGVVMGGPVTGGRRSRPGPLPGDSGCSDATAPRAHARLLFPPPACLPPCSAPYAHHRFSSLFKPKHGCRDPFIQNTGRRPEPKSWDLHRARLGPPPLLAGRRVPSTIGNVGSRPLGYLWFGTTCDPAKRVCEMQSQHVCRW